MSHFNLRREQQEWSCLRAVQRMSQQCLQSTYRRVFVGWKRNSFSFSWFCDICCHVLHSSHHRVRIQGPGLCSLLVLRSSQATARPLSRTCPTPWPHASCRRRMWSPDCLTVLLGSSQAFSLFPTEFERALGGPCKSTFTEGEGHHYETFLMAHCLQLTCCSKQGCVFLLSKVPCTASCPFL